MKINRSESIKIDRETLIALLRQIGINVPDDATLRVDNGAEYDAHREAEIGPDGPLVVSWESMIEIGTRTA